MAVTAKEAKRLIAQHKKLLSDLDDIAQVGVEVSREIDRYARDPFVSASLAHIIVKDCEQRAECFDRDVGVDRLILYLYRYQKMSRTLETANAYRGNAKKIICKYVDTLAAGATGVLRFFRGKSAKEDAEKALRSYRIF